jgi:hypothetical protein
VLEAPFTSAVDVGAQHYWFVPVLGHPAFVPDVAGYLEKIERNDDRVN